MEKVLSPEERIRRAEEIYSRRKNENRNNYYTSNSRVKYQSTNTRTIKEKMIRKMLIQIVACTIIYIIIYTIQNSNQIFSTEIMNKAKEILAYDISLEGLYNKSAEYFNDAREQLNGVLNVNDSESENIESPDDNNQEMDNTETENLEESNTELNIIEDTQEQTSQQEAVGGAEEVAQVEEKSQEELDIEYVKQNINIIWPIKGTITSRFGSRTPTEIVTANHYGVDIAGNIGDDIVSAIDGTVTLSSSEGDYGKHIRVESGEVMTVYAHCSELLVKEGDIVKQGETIAKVGQTGRATGPHLHFEIRRENRFVNPEDILETMWGNLCR